MCDDYTTTTKLGVNCGMAKATRQYADRSAAAELRMLSKEGVLVHKVSRKEIALYCGRGMPWRTKMVTVGGETGKHIIANQAWSVRAVGAFESDVYGTIVDILTHMFKRKGNGIAL